MSENKNGSEEKLYRQDSIENMKSILENIGGLNGLDGYRVMGKTGTARMVENGKYTNKRHVYSYGGIIEKDDLKRVVVTFIKEPKATHLWASQITAPLFKNIADVPNFSMVLGSAPASRSNSMFSSSPFQDVMSRAVSPSLSTAFGSAPAFRSILTMAEHFVLAAYMRAVRPI